MQGINTAQCAAVEIRGVNTTARTGVVTCCPDMLMYKTLFEVLGTKTGAAVSLYWGSPRGRFY